MTHIGAKPPRGTAHNMGAAVTKVLAVLEDGGVPADYVNVCLNWKGDSQVRVVYGTAGEAQRAAQLCRVGEDALHATQRGTIWTWRGWLDNIEIQFQGNVIERAHCPDPRCQKLAHPDHANGHFIVGDTWPDKKERRDARLGDKA